MSDPWSLSIEELPRRQALAREITRLCQEASARNGLAEDEITSVQYAREEGIGRTTAKTRLGMLVELGLAEVRWVVHESHRVKAYRIKKAP